MVSFRQTVAGQQKKWTLLEKLGEGDAGEVYHVETLLDSQPAILKRPRRSNLPSDIMRQASQIRNEGRILQALSEFSISGQGLCLSAPALLDQSPPEVSLGEGYFIVIAQASGFDLKSLLRLARTGLVEEMQPVQSEADEYFIRTIAGLGYIPEAILVRSLLNVIALLETIHSRQDANENTSPPGIIWNDVKPEHLFWDPSEICLTVIDWGNSDFLEADGITKDRLHSAREDFSQFLSEMGVFLAESSPDLYERLGWADEAATGNAQEAVERLRKRLVPLVEDIAEQVKTLRSAEALLYQTSRPTLEHIAQSDHLQREIVSLGEMPDFASAVNFHARLALQFAAEDNLDGFQHLCARIAKLASSSTQKWELLAKIAATALSYQNEPGSPAEKSFASAFSAGVADDWPGLLWEIFELIGTESPPEWWEDVSQGVRRVYLHIDEDVNTPDVTVRRLYYTLQTAVVQTGETRPGSAADEAGADRPQLASGDILKLFDEEVVKKWREIEPAPPNSGISYAGVSELFDRIEAILPGTLEPLEKVLAQPQAHSEIVLDAWQRKDFETARQALRRLLLWDPNRRRLLLADRMISSAPQWLREVRSGAGKDKPFYDYLTSVELAGRKLRNRVGPAEWLDSLLDALRRLRKGTRPADLLMDHPSILDYIPWLNEIRSREILSLPRSHALLLERDQPAARQLKTISGEVEGRLGDGQDVHLGEPLDTWVSEARGSSARVFAGQLRTRSGSQSLFAIKVMRPERVEYALPLFKEETHILSLLNDVPGVTPLVECGYLRLDEGTQLPREEDSQGSAAHLQGMVVRYSVEAAQTFLASIEGRLAQGWLPYLALVLRDHRHNLLSYCDAGYTRGWFLPLRESLLLAIQICEILQIAHDRNIAYRDHKILHYYWEPGSHGVEMIDWNIAKRYSQGLTDAERQFDLVQFGARALHHILTGRPAPGALPLGPNQPEEIEHASSRYAVSWTYDDERLPIRVKEITEQVLNQGYTHVRDLRADLVQVYQQIPEAVQDADSPVI